MQVLLLATLSAHVLIPRIWQFAPNHSLLLPGSSLLHWWVNGRGFSSSSQPSSSEGMVLPRQSPSHRGGHWRVCRCWWVTLRGMECVPLQLRHGHKATLLILHSTLNNETHQKKNSHPSLVRPCSVVSDKLRAKCC